MVFLIKSMGFICLLGFIRKLKTQVTFIQINFSRVDSSILCGN